MTLPKKLKDKFEIKGGYMDGKVMPLEEVQALANIPALPVLQAQALGTMLAPITGLAVVLKQIAKRAAKPHLLQRKLLPRLCPLNKRRRVDPCAGFGP